MTKTITWVAGGVAVGLLVWWVLPAYFSSAPPDPRSPDYLNKIAAEINRSVPVMIDEETELLPTTTGHAMLIYNYRLVKYSVAQLDHQKFAAGAKLKVTQGACSRPETRDGFLKEGVTLRYSYFDREKQHIATFDVTPAACGF
jgi:hypothetical protein